jgi:hypothetical protein
MKSTKLFQHVMSCRLDSIPPKHNNQQKYQSHHLLSTVYFWEEQNYQIMIMMIDADETHNWYPCAKT